MPRRSKLFWERVASIPWLTAPWPVWRQVGTGFALIEPYLRQTGKVADHLYCERCGCSHRIVPGLRDGWVAVCNCGCEDLPVQETDRVLHELEVGRLLASVGEMFPLQVRPERLGGAWLVGRGSRSRDGQPLNLIICPSDRSSVITPSATAVLRAGLIPCLFASQSPRFSEIESLLPPGSRACLLAELITVSDGGFGPGLLAKQLLAGWTDDSSSSERCGGPQYALRKDGRIWTIVFQGKSASWKDEKGISYVAYLLKNPPSEPIHGAKLAARVSGYADISELSLGRDDSASRRAVEEEAKECAAVLQDDGASELEREEARGRLEELARIRNQVTKRPQTNAERTVRAVRKALQRLHEQLASQKGDDGTPHPVLVPFADHIERYLLNPSARYSGRRNSRVRAGVAGGFTYEPPDGVTWAD